MKRILCVLILLSLCAASALADPIPLLEDYAMDIVEPYDPEDPSAGTFEYHYRYPHVDESAEGGADINEFYVYLTETELPFYIQTVQDIFDGMDSSTDITYTVTCNNDDYFSVLVRKEENNPDTSRVYWEAHVFSRKNGVAGKTYSLPKVLGILSSDESDEWLQDRQTAKADNLVREMVWAMIEENEDGVEYDPTFTEEALSHVLFPEEQFYLDENGDPVFYLQPGTAAPESAGLLVFPISLEDILDEM